MSTNENNPTGNPTDYKIPLTPYKFRVALAKGFSDCMDEILFDYKKAAFRRIIDDAEVTYAANRDEGMDHKEAIESIKDDLMDSLYWQVGFLKDQIDNAWHKLASEVRYLMEQEEPCVNQQSVSGVNQQSVSGVNQQPSP